MINRANFNAILLSDSFGFKVESDVYYRHYGSVEGGFDLKYNSALGQFVYPEGIRADRGTTLDSHQQESFVVFLCVAQLFARGYQPRNIVLEGKNYSGADRGYCDVLVVPDNAKYKDDQFLIIECKTSDLAQKDDEFRKHWQKTLRNGDQLFRYFNTYRKAKYLCLFTADYPKYTKNGRSENRYENIYNIISLVDNDEYLQTDSSLKSFKSLRKELGSADEFFGVWKDTYKQDYNTRGLFEEGVRPFEIGKKNYSLLDLKTVDEYSLEKKYNEFSLILRKHTISSHENAFDKLINLFIAKIIDEKYNAKQLDLLWKGAANDDYFSLQDRLNELYRVGMKEFFNDEVTFVENKKIDEAFCFLTSKADVAKDTIKRYFRQLKYFNNNPFAFLDVHNEQLFYQNAVILKDVIAMLQEIYLTSNTDNQFLGDLFEGFLHKGVHQSEGQFFTPIPIVRFLISSLPIQSILEKNGVPRVIDYACGAGHFLTEYARQIRAITSERNKKDEKKISDYFCNIVGVEKDYRLSKVSQVAAFMYGMDGMRIHFSDGLANIPSIKDNTFDVLVANPPYSVSGFLETLDEEDRNRYRLASSVGNIAKNNAIETFFIERASQLLASGGVATVILPTSVLTKGGIYMRTRELLLEKFDLISIVCLGPSTFGQTSTSTVALFLRRKVIEPDISIQVKNRINAWFLGNFKDDEFYNDSEYLNAYLDKMGYNRPDYESLMNGELTDAFLRNEIVQEYVRTLNLGKNEKQPASASLVSEAKVIRDEAQKAYARCAEDEKKKIEIEYTISFIREIEKEKLYYFILAKRNPQPVLVVHSPQNKKNEKKFLGYEWSNRKGCEGIHYLNVDVKKDSSGKDDGEDDVDDTIAQLRGIDGIETPLFNPLDLFDGKKINSLIRKNFNGESLEIENDLKEFVCSYDLTEMLDFSLATFDKTIKDTVEDEFIFESKYELQRLNDSNKFFIEIGRRVLSKDVVSKPDKTHHIPVYSANVNKIFGYVENSIWNNFDAPSILWGIDGDWQVSLIPKDTPFYPTDHCGVIRVLSADIDTDYLFYTLTILGRTRNFARTHRPSTERIKSMRIPLPPKKIQNKIVSKCRAINEEMNKSIMQTNNSLEKQEIVENAYKEMYDVLDKYFK